jgi:alkylated DNA repair dioxygenase AlkB
MSARDLTTSFSQDGAQIDFYSRFYSEIESDKIFETLSALPFTDSRNFNVFTQKVGLMPRKMLWFSDLQEAYYAFGKNHLDMLPPHEFTKLLGKIRDDVEEHTGKRFNSLLINFYPDVKSSVSWHNDKDPWLGDPVKDIITVPSLSFGAPRPFQLKKKSKAAKIPVQEFMLGHGSMIIMDGMTQADWLHQVPPVTKKMLTKGAKKGPRINLTFRNVVKKRIPLQMKMAGRLSDGSPNTKHLITKNGGVIPPVGWSAKSLTSNKKRKLN